MMRPVMALPELSILKTGDKRAIARRDRDRSEF
jgi:hypothetical protein